MKGTQNRDPVVTSGYCCVICDDELESASSLQWHMLLF